MEKIRLTSKNKQFAIKRAVKVLKQGGIIIYPTETCYGVGVDATNKQAVKKLLEYKDRPEGKAISIAVSSEVMASEYVEINETANNLYTNFLPGPVTVVSKIKSANQQMSNKTNTIAQGIAAEDRSLGIRIPDYPFTLELIKKFGKPITATSANRSGKKTPYSISDIQNNTTKKRWGLINLILDAGELPHNPPSTVVDTRFNQEKILRAGEMEIGKLGNWEIRKSQKQYITKTEQETQEVARKIMLELIPKLKKHCVVFALSGELGAGKTQFAKGVGKALGIKEPITSPTFVLVREYDFNIKYQISNIKYKTKKTGVTDNRYLKTEHLIHVDTWRMRESKELLDLGFVNMVKIGNVIVVEWMEKVSEIISNLSQRKDVLVVWVGIEDGKEYRIIYIKYKR